MLDFTDGCISGIISGIGVGTSAGKLWSGTIPGRIHVTVNPMMKISIVYFRFSG
jgi:hypothetical protein